jgi:hypothetical protein
MVNKLIAPEVKSPEKEMEKKWKKECRKIPQIEKEVVE